MEPKTKACVSLAVFIDALGWELLKEQQFLVDEAPARRPLQTIFGYSATCDPTILTGALPRDHGHFSFFAYDPSSSPFHHSLLLTLMRLVPRSLASRNRVRSIVSRLLKGRLGYTGYFNIYNMPFRLLPLFDYTEKRDIYQPGGINSGLPTVMDYAREKGIDFFLSDWRKPETENLAALTGALSDPDRDCSFAYLYMASMDAVLHQYGKPHPAVTDKMQWYDRQIRELLETARRYYREVRIFIFSDHGMTNVSSLCDLQQTIVRSGLKFAHDYAAVYDSTMARFWFLNDGAEKRIREVLAEEKNGRILTPKEQREWGIDFPDNRYGDMIFLLNPGVLLLPSHMGERPIAGMHGYEPEDPDSVASFCTNVDLETWPERLDDLYALMKGEIDRCQPNH
jgi:hypothetical protein